MRHQTGTIPVGVSDEVRSEACNDRGENLERSDRGIDGHVDDLTGSDDALVSAEAR